jgi:hypothetical protein
VNAYQFKRAVVNGKKDTGRSFADGERRSHVGSPHIVDMSGFNGTVMSFGTV